MRSLLLAAVGTAMVLALSSSAMAGSKGVTATGTGTATSSSNSGAVAIGGGGGTATATGGQGGSAQGGSAQSNSSIVFNTPGSTTSTTTSRIHQGGSLKTTANAIAPGLGSAAVETCYGPGVSAGVGFTGGAVSFGAGQYDEECNLRLWARTAYAFGQKDLAGALMAQSPAIMRAMKMLDEQRGTVYGGRGPVYGAPVYGTPVASAAGGSCGKWSGGAQGVGTCLWYK